MSNHLPARPNLDHLKKQAKALLAGLKDGDRAAVQSFMTHLPAARKMSAAKVRAAGFRLADAQSVVARASGFDSWTALARHVEQLRLLEGEWRFVGLEIDGTSVPAAATSSSRLMMDGDRFRMESPEGNYEGIFTIDASADPMRIDIASVEGPEANNSSYGIYELDGDQLTMCIGVVGASRPVAFKTSAGSGHALERLRRASTDRPRNVTGGTRQPVPEDTTKAASSSEAAAFDRVAMTPLMRRFEGNWAATALVRDGLEMPNEWLAFGSRVATGNEVKVVFGGQVMVHAKVRLDASATPIAVDYLNLAGGLKGKVSLGIMEWAGDEVRFLIAAPGQPRPKDFSTKSGRGLTFSQWKRK